MAEAAVRILSGQSPSDLKIPAVGMGPPQYDWRELQHWNISEDRLPAGSVVRFREPTVWQNYRQQIAFICALVLLQGGMIAGLLHERRRRHYFEVEASRRSAELAHFNRYSMAGELTASIAHELNQPLGAILTNAETAELLLKSSSPNLDEIREIVADIRRDDERAGEVIQRLRSMLKKAPPEIKDFDLNEVVRNTILILSPLAIAREVDFKSVLFPEPLPIRGDRVQLQQVLVNLIVNAMDAMSGPSSAGREVTISTARKQDFAEISVLDAGPGIPPDKIKEVFEPFFTTKAQGMGMGLSIARTIVEAHKGRIWAENHSGGGADFRIQLPLKPT
jgi:signal transduction histidine kinase